MSTVSSTSATPFTDDEAVKLFFTDRLYMAIAVRTFEQLKVEGIEKPEDLIDYDKDALERIESALRKPLKKKKGGTGTDANELVEQEPFKLTAMSFTRLEVAHRYLEYLETTGHLPTTSNTTWVIMKRFDEEWTAIQERKKEKPEVPLLTKGLTVVKWLDSFMILLRAWVGVRKIPLLYCAREEVTPMNPPDFESNLPYSAEHGSVEDELIARASQAHPLFTADNRQLFELLEQALRHSPLATSLVQYRKKNDGKSALIAIRTQFAGIDVYEAMIGKAVDFMTNRKWTGTTNVTLHSHIAKHRSSYMDLTVAAEHVPHQLPNGRTRVTNLLESITCKDPEVIAACTSVKQDKGGVREDFELASTAIAPTCPVKKKQQQRGQVKSIQAEISAATATTGGGGGSDLGAGRCSKTGVEYRYYHAKEYRQLNEAQKKALRDWKASNSGGGGGGGAKRKSGGDANATTFNKKKLKAMISAAVAAKQTPALEAVSQTQQAIIAALGGQKTQQSAQVSAAAATPTPADPPATPQDNAALLQLCNVASVKLQSILKNGKKQKKTADR